MSAVSRGMRAPTAVARHRRSLAASCRLAVSAGVGALAAVGLMRLSGSGPQLRVPQMTGQASPTWLNVLNIHRSQSTFSFSAPTAMSSLAPPQPPPKWTHTPDEVLALTKGAIARHRGQQDAVAALAPADCNFSSVRAAS